MESQSKPDKPHSGPFWYGSEDDSICQEIFRRFAKHLKVEESHTNISPRNPNKREPEIFVGKIIRHAIPSPNHTSFETIDAVYLFTNGAQPVDGRLVAKSIMYTNTLWSVEDAVPYHVSGLYKHTYDQLMSDACCESSTLICQPFYMQGRRYRYLVTPEEEASKTLAYADSRSLMPTSCCWQHDTSKECLCQHHYTMDHRERPLSCEDSGMIGADPPAAASYLRDHGLDVFLRLRESCSSDGIHDTDFSETGYELRDDSDGDSDTDSDTKEVAPDIDNDLTECEEQRCFDEFETMVATVSSESLHIISNTFLGDSFGDDENSLDTITLSDDSGSDDDEAWENHSTPSSHSFEDFTASTSGLVEATFGLRKDASW